MDIFQEKNPYSNSLLSECKSRLNNIINDILKYHPDVVDKKELNRDPLDELILTILSQNTTDTNSGRAFRELKRYYTDYRSILKDDVSSLSEVIRIAGLHNIKAKRIKGILKEIEEREGKLSLKSLHNLTNEKALEYLISLKGVGYKTASCVLAFSLNRDVIPVDTHILRVGKRVGFLPDDANSKKAHYLINKITPEGKGLHLHLALIRHGRTVCKARSPLCEDCCIKGYCIFYGS